MSKILITGGSGLVGKALTDKLIKKGYQVNWLSRNNKKSSKANVYQWNTKENFIDEQAFEGVSCIIHLAGANIFRKRWTDAYKKKIADSRIKTAQLLYDYVKKHNIPLKTFISSSAIGYYGTFTSEQILTEESPQGNDFLAQVCIEWERKAQQFEILNIRHVCVRTGVVLSKYGGAFPPIKKAISNYIGTPLGTGNQYMPWIHIEDLTNIYLKAVEDNTMQGAYNATSSSPTTNEQLTVQIAKAIRMPLLFPKVPTLLLKLLLGERAILLLEGTHVQPQRIQQKKISFSFSKLEDAIGNILE